MRRLVQVSFFYVCLLFSLAATAQTYNDGPMELLIRVNTVRVDYRSGGHTTSDDFNLSGSIGSVIGNIISIPSLEVDEIAVKVWARDNVGMAWQGGTCFNSSLPMSSGGPETYNVLPGVQQIFTGNYGATNVPGTFDLRLEGWEDDKSSDFDQLPNIPSFLGRHNCRTANGFSNCTYEGTDTDCFTVTLVGDVFAEQDDKYCDGNPFQTGFDYRAAGPPCQWNNHGFTTGTCPNNPYYQVEVQSYYRFTAGVSCNSPIDMGSFTPGQGTFRSHLNSNTCYTNTLPGSQPGNDVFYKFSITAPMGVDVTLCDPATLFDTYVYLLDANCQIIDQNDDGTGVGCGTRSLISKSLCTPGDYYVVVDAKTAQSTGSFRLFITENPSFTFGATLTATNPKCNGGTDGKLKATVIGGQSPFTYAWSNTVTGVDSITGLSAGIYTFTVTDANSCNVIKTDTLINPPAMTVTTSATDLTCSGANDGTASATVTGGTPPYFYAWNSLPAQTSQTAVSLPVGAYLVTVTDLNNCFVSSTTPANVNANNPIVITDTVENISCFGQNDGEVRLGVSGGVPAYAYSWSRGGSTSRVATGLTPGTITITITDATPTGNCSVTETFLITEPTLLAVQITDTSSISPCNGDNNGAVALAVTGGTPGYTYEWSSGSTAGTLLDAAGGPFTVTITDANGCTVTTGGTLDEPSAIVPSITAIDAGCGEENGGATLTVSGGVGSYTFFWSNFSTSQDLTNVAAGSYLVNITDAAGCTQTDTVTINGGDGLIISPTVSSPCTDVRNGKISVNVTGGTGTYTYLWSDNSTADSLGLIPAGTYSVTVTDGNNCTASATFNVTENTNCSGGGIIGVVAPNVFSPNGDGKNDYFDLFAADDVSKIEVKIFDRWGAKVYENPNQPANNAGINQGWDGTTRGKEVQSGSYVYLMNIEYSTPQTVDRPYQKTGTITVVK